MLGGGVIPEVIGHCGGWGGVEGGSVIVGNWRGVV